MSYSPAWVDAFEREVSKLSGWLKDELIVAHHIGSTAIPNMTAKPIIDLLIEVSSKSNLDAVAALFEADGYEVRGEYGIAGRRYFSKGPSHGELGCHIHAYEVGNPEIARHLAFRDYLRLKPEVAAQYAELKRQLSDADGVLQADYQNQKKPWVDATAQQALTFFGK